MVRIVYIASFFFLLSSCISDGRMYPIPPQHLLHDNESKVWLLAEDVNGNKDYTPFKRAKKQTFLFFADGTFFIQQINEWGTDKFDAGNYSFKGSEDESAGYSITLTFRNGDKVAFNVIDYNRNQFILEYKSKPGRKLKLTNLTKPYDN